MDLRKPLPLYEDFSDQDLEAAITKNRRELLAPLGDLASSDELIDLSEALIEQDKTVQA